MTMDQLRQAQRAQPFRPFTIHLADGRALHVPHRDFLSLPPGGQRTVIVYGPDDSFSIIDMLLVTELHMDSPQATSNSP